MGYEAATYINELVATNPVSADDRESQGYLHIQNIKQALQNTFPAANAPITATHTELNLFAGLTASSDELNVMFGVTATTAEINYLASTTSGIQSQLDGKRKGVTTIRTNYDSITVLHTAVAGEHWVIKKEAPYPTLRLPTSPSPGDVVRVSCISVSDESYVTISPNGNRLRGTTVNGRVFGNSDGSLRYTAELVYSDSTTGWALTEGWIDL